MVASETPAGEPGRSAASGSSTASGALPTEPGFVADSGNNGGSEVLPAEAGHPVVTPAAEPGGRDAVATETRADHTAPGAGEPVDADLRPASAERGGQTGPATGVLRGGLADGSPAESGGVEPARAGFVVSKAVGGAVVRNRVKRRLRHLMAEQIDRLPPGATIVVRAQPSAAQRAYQEMAMDLENALDAALRPGRRQ